MTNDHILPRAEFSIMKAVAMEYVKTQRVWQMLIDRALDYAVELREKQPDVLDQLISDLELYTQADKSFSKEWLTS